MNDLTFNILKIVVSACAVLIAYYAIPYVKNKIKSDKYAELLAIIDVAVRAAEQTIKGSGMGALKKDNVVIFVTEWANKAGIAISQDQLNQLIEAAVFNMNQGV